MAVRRVKIKGPFHGIITDQPPTSDDQGFEAMVNFLCRKGRIINRPGLDLANKFSQPGNQVVLNLTSFEDIENALHTLALTTQGVYMLTSLTGPPNITFNPLTIPTYISTAVLNAKGLGYIVDDIVYINQVSGQGGTITVLAVDGQGGITAYQLISGGSNYITATNVPTSSPGNGSGATFDITVNTLTQVGESTSLPYALVKAQNRAYFCNGSAPLCYSDGEASYKISGDVPGACRFLTVNAGHMIGAVWSEPAPPSDQAILYPSRVRWSDSGNFDAWNEADPNLDAGVADLIDVPDSITGLSTIGNNSYVYRTNGISTMIPTGSAAEPFYIPNFSTSDKGEGNQYPYSLVSHNNIDRFIGESDVWAFDGTNYKGLMEGKCNGEFFSQLTQINPISGFGGTVRGILTTVWDNGFPYLAYVITLPGLNTAWVLNIKEETWTVVEWAPPVAGQAGFFDLQLIEQVYLT